MMFAAPPEQTLEWNDAGVEGAYRFLRRRLELRRQARRDASTAAPARRRGRGDAAQGAAPRDPQVLQQVDYDYERMQYNTVVSGAMKLLNALEDVQGRRERRRATARAARGLRHPAARALSGLRRTSRRRCGTSSATPQRTATCSMRRGRRSTRRAGAGRDRAGAAGQRQAARLDPRAGRRATRRRSKRPRSRARVREASPRASRRRRSSSCRAAWSTRGLMRRRRRVLGSPLASRSLRSPAAASSCGGRPSCASDDRSSSGFAGALAARRGAAQRSIDASPTTRVVDSARAGAGRARGACRGAREERRRARPPSARCASSSCARASRSACARRRQGADRRRPRSCSSRDMSYNESAALAKEQEEAFAVPRHAERHRLAGDAPARLGAARLRRDADAALRRPARRPPAARAARRSTRCGATSRCWRRRPATRSAPRRAPPAAASARCTPSPARTSTGAALLGASQAMSLFADRQLIEIRIPSGKPGKDGSRGAAALLRDRDRSAAATSSRWSSCRGSTGRSNRAPGSPRSTAPASRCASIRSSGKALPAWIAAAPGARRASASPQAPRAQRALAFFADRVEGNLLAAHQEIQKLALLYPRRRDRASSRSRRRCSTSRATTSSRLGEAVLAGQVARALRMLDGLRAEGEAAVLVHWTLAEDIRGLKRVKDALADGKPLPLALREARVWGAQGARSSSARVHADERVDARRTCSRRRTSATASSRDSSTPTGRSIRGKR